MIQFNRPDGKGCPGYIATPTSGAGGPGIVVIQEWWGLNEQIKKTADRFAEAGYRALVPDLYRGKIAKASDEANHLMNDLNFPDAATQDIRGAVQFLKSSQKVAVTGFCMGGAVTFLAALYVPEMDAGIPFYGIPPIPFSEFQKITIPLSCHFANRDNHYSPEKVNELESALKKSKSQFELFRYDAQHAFMNEARPQVFDPVSAKLAWDRILTFMKKTIG
jgi:carboxymethylenebutenolidase